MGWFILIAYLLGAALAFRSSVRFGVHESDYPWDMTDMRDVSQLTVVSLVVAVFWPLALIAGLLVVIVKRIFANAEAGK